MSRGQPPMTSTEVINLLHISRKIRERERRTGEMAWKGVQVGMLGHIAGSSTESHVVLNALHYPSASI